MILESRRIKRYSAEEIVGQHFSRFYPKETRDSGHPAFELKQAAALGRFEDEGWRVRKDGSQFWANVVITALHDSGGQLIGFSKITRDLTERKAQEETLRQSEENLRLLIETVDDHAIYRLDTDGTVVSWNRGVNGSRATAPPRSSVSTFRAFARRQPKDHGGMLRGYLKITPDLTERRRHEESLKESEQRLRLLVDGVTDHAIVMLSPDARFLGWNDGAERLYGYSSAESAGHGADILYTPEDVACNRPQQDLDEAAARDSIQLSGWRMRRDGSRFWGDITLTAVRHENGALRAYVQITKDVTQGRRIAELETKGKRIEEFIAMLAHPRTAATLSRR